VYFFIDVQIKSVENFKPDDRQSWLAVCEHLNCNKFIHINLNIYPSIMMQLYADMWSTAKYALAYVCVLLIHFIATSVYAKVCVPIHSDTWSEYASNLLYTAFFSSSNFCIGTKMVMDSTSASMASSTSSLCTFTGAMVTVEAIIGKICAAGSRNLKHKSPTTRKTTSETTTTKTPTTSETTTTKNGACSNSI